MSLAERFNGEIINGDAIQMYDGLSIASNKLSAKQRRSIPHHLLGCIRLEDKPWEVSTFRRNALKVAEEIRSRGKLPILVGGTHYYAQSLLFRNALVEVDELKAEATEGQDRQWPVLYATTQEMLEELRKIDPAMAARWHPNDRRKIRRSLEIYFTTGKKASDIYEQQRKRRPGFSLDRIADNIDPKDVVDDENQNLEYKVKSSLLFDSLIFWAHSDPEVLKQRIDKRLQDMLADGLVSEAETLYAALQNLRSEGHIIDQSCGIWAAIGYKEFEPYLSALHAAKVSKEELEKLKNECIEQTRLECRKYAKSQVKWIRLKLIRALADGDLDKTLYLLDGSDFSRRSRDVETIAFDIAESFLKGEPRPSPMSVSEAAERMLVTCDERVTNARYCGVCDKTLMSDYDWELHLKGRKHVSSIKPKVDWSALYPRKLSSILTKGVD